MLRNPALIPLSRQHHDGLALCVLTRRGLAADRSAENIARLAKRAVDHYELELAGHFRIEEQTLFPEVERRLGPLPLVAELVAQHREMERLIEVLRGAPAGALLEQLCEVLTAHIRREENELFETLQARLPAEVLRELGAVIANRAARVCM